ncbi:MAG: methylase, partial [Methanobacteriota archaeon]
IAAALTGPAAVIATDINPYAAAAARSLGLDVVRADLCSGLRGEFDLVIFNPPYLPTQDEERIDDWLECALDGGESGRDVIERFAASVGSVLADGGRVLMVISSLTGPVEVARIFLRAGFSTRVVRRRAVEGGEELMVLRGVRTAAVPPRSLG